MVKLQTQIPKDELDAVARMFEDDQAQDFELVGYFADVYPDEDQARDQAERFVALFRMLADEGIRRTRKRLDIIRVAENFIKERADSGEPGYSYGYWGEGGEDISEEEFNRRTSNRAEQ